MNVIGLTEDKILIIGLAAVCITYITAKMVKRCWLLLMRHLSIRAHGWPPPHCDADGEFRQEEEL